MFGSSRSADDVRYCDTPSNFASSRFGQSNQRPFNSSRYGDATSLASSNARVPFSFKDSVTGLSQNMAPFNSSSRRLGPLESRVQRGFCTGRAYSDQHVDPSTHVKPFSGSPPCGCTHVKRPDIPKYYSSTHSSCTNHQEFHSSSRNLACSQHTNEHCLPRHPFRTSGSLTDLRDADSLNLYNDDCDFDCSNYGYWDKKKRQDKKISHMTRCIDKAMEAFHFTPNDDDNE